LGGAASTPTVTYPRGLLVVPPKNGSVATPPEIRVGPVSERGPEEIHYLFAVETVVRGEGK